MLSLQLPVTGWMRLTNKAGVTFIVLVFLWLTAATKIGATTVNVDCNKGDAVGPILSRLKPGDVVLVHGTCQENILIQAELQRITLDGQGKATIKAANARQPAIQVFGREVTIKGFTVNGGSFGIAINRGATAVIDTNTIDRAAVAGLEVSHNSFARVLNNTIQRNEGHGILVLGSSSVHIGVWYTDDKVPQPNVIQNNDGDGVQVLRSSTARIIGNTLSGNRRSGLTVQQASHADVAGNVINGSGQHGIRVVGNSGVNLADSAMRLFEQPNYRPIESPDLDDWKMLATLYVDESRLAAHVATRAMAERLVGEVAARLGTAATLVETRSSVPVRMHGRASSLLVHAE